MDQLKTKVVNVVLTIQESKGWDAILKSSVFLSANFNGRILESDHAIAEEPTIFNTNLVWEVEKRDLRKIRCSNQPLRVDCFLLTDDKRDRFGHLLLDLRSAQILEPNQIVPFKWHKLIGVRNKKRNSSPELYVSLTIRNPIEEITTPSAEELWIPEPRAGGNTPIQYLNDGFVQVGEPPEDSEDLSLNIVIKAASNLDLLLPEVLVFNQNRNKYFLTIKIFGIPIKTKSFTKDLHDKVVFEERIVVRLRSSLEILTNFFKEEKVDVDFCCGSDVLGITTISFEDLCNLNEKLCLNFCHFRFPSHNGIVPTSVDLRKPTLSLELFLIQIEPSRETLIESLDSPQNAGCGDQALLITEEQIRELEEWKEDQKSAFMEELEALKAKELEDEENRLLVLEELQQKKMELEENVTKCRQLQEELAERMEEVNLSKTLRKKLKSSTNLPDLLAENQKKFADCEKDLLIEYISKLQGDNENLKSMVNDQKLQVESLLKTALTKEQTTNLLQELKGLEEKFEVAQQSKTYFKEQWQKACQEIHDLKAEDYRQLQKQLRERREELSKFNVVH